MVRLYQFDLQMLLTNLQPILPYQPCCVQKLEGKLDRDLEYAIQVEGKMKVRGAHGGCE